MKTFHIIFEGVVQGVFFRDFIRKNSIHFKIKGYAKNLRDGRVEAVFQGEEKDIMKLIDLCKSESGAEVTNVIITQIPNKNYEGFLILR